jgi:hypothetical protein
MWPFQKKPPWEEQYAQNLYGAFVERNAPGDITALKLRIPTALHHAYQSKMVLQRELFSFAALASVANPGSKLQPVMRAYGNLLVDKMAKRDLQMSEDQLANAACDDLDAMIADPFIWAQRWLSEFREDPNDNYMVALFADHCGRLIQAYKYGLEETQPR